MLSSCLKNWTIIRPYITFSDARLQLSCLEKEYWLKRVLDNKPIVFSKDLANKTTTFTCGNDVAGVRIVCAFIDDIYMISDLITQQDDIKVIEITSTNSSDAADIIANLVRYSKADLFLFC